MNPATADTSQLGNPHDERPAGRSEKRPATGPDYGAGDALNSAEPTSGNPNLEQLVHAAVSQLPDFRGVTLICERNCEKYAARSSDEKVGQLERVFDLMRDLNAHALADPKIAADEHGHHGFRASLLAAVDGLVDALGDQPITYVEFGPEPMKTRDILARLLDAEVPVARYLAVDINPTSESRMREALQELLPQDRIGFLNAPFEAVAPERLHTPGAATVLTSMGFQEGNDHPDEVARTLGHLLRPGDLVFSEMQVADHGDNTPFEAFYNTPLMRGFSRLCVARSMPDTESSFRLAITDVDCGLQAPVRVCAMCEDLPADAEGQPRSFITNICLKPTSRQWREARVRDGRFSVLAQRLTGDRSVAFQVALRTAVELETDDQPQQQGAG